MKELKPAPKPTKRCGCANRRIRKEMKRLGLGWIAPLEGVSSKLFHLICARNTRIKDKERLQNRGISPMAQEAVAKLGGGFLRRF
jgi:hypothetical protein